MRWVAIIAVWLALCAPGVTVIWLMPGGNRYSIAIWVLLSIAIGGYQATRLMVPEVDEAEDEPEGRTS